MTFLLQDYVPRIPLQLQQPQLQTDPSLLGCHPSTTPSHFNRVGDVTFLLLLLLQLQQLQTAPSLLGRHSSTKGQYCYVPLQQGQLVSKEQQQLLLRITSPYLRSNGDTAVTSKIFERHLDDPRPWTEVAAIRIRGCRGHPRSSPSHPPLTPIAHNSTLIDALFGRRRATSFESRGLYFQLRRN